MFKHILIPTDGSVVAKIAIDAGLALAKEIDAKVTGYYALPTSRCTYSQDQDLDETLRERYAALVREKAEHAMNVIRLEAKDAAVPFEALITTAESPYEGIIKAAKRCECDVIVMASNGRSGLPEQMLGSVTHKVLQLSKIPVLVYR